MPGRQLHESMPRPGCILFLPPKDEITLDVEGEHGLPQPGAFNHPVVVLSKEKTKSRVAILIVTSFRGKRLLDKDENFRKGYLPVHPSQPHPESGLLLRLDNSSTLDKASCVKISKYYIVPYSILRNLRNRQRYALSGSSYNPLVNEAEAFISWKDLRSDLEAAVSLRPKPVQRIKNLSAKSMSANGYGTMSSVTRPPTSSPQADSMRPSIMTTYPRHHPSRHSRIALGQPLWATTPPRSDNWGYRYIVAPIWGAVKTLMRLMVCLGSKPAFWQFLMWLLIWGVFVYGIIKAISGLVDFLRNVTGEMVAKVYAWFT